MDAANGVCIGHFWNTDRGRDYIRGRPVHIHVVLGCGDVSSQPDERAHEIEQAKLASAQLVKPGENGPATLDIANQTNDQEDTGMSASYTMGSMKYENKMNII